jgi:hypothetical protein
VVGALTVIFGAVATIYKLQPDRDVLMITQAQGASTILNDLVDTLREELTRERERTKDLESRNASLENELQGLRQRFGTREDDAV